MRVDLLTREYPPEVYGGAGVHVAELVRALRTDIDVVVRAFGAPRDEAGTFGYATPDAFVGRNAAVGTMGVDLLMAADAAGADLVHSHTWYANFAGFTAKRLHGVPHVVTAHSLEPLRPWKAEQLGGGYRLSSWVERTAFEDADAVIAVSEGMRRDILRSYPSIDPSKVEVVYNGIDLVDWRPNRDPGLARTLGLDPERPSVVFVGRITRQKGLPYLLRAARLLPPEVQLVLCAGAPDTEEIMAEVTGLVDELRSERDGVVWIDRHLPRAELTALLTAATVFVCPSVYEPLGIVNLEAMACGAPVVGTATGGIPEVVDDGVTGVLVPIEQADDGTGTPLDPERFVSDLAAALTRVVLDPTRAAEMGAAGRRRAEEHFAWNAIAARTRDLYARVLAG
ncbi:starch synthase [Agromyces terreus]|uniref:D-inositol 3-phosphate glycosyltransferase n=1 Tax=Agromyces terreus TaxID=424795 RepID=A0A9X2H2W8_9MICO|nr:glycogen synthase [Agromyces terreus]MCP2371968.1 starch synthase [Agromyces terreus]